MSWPDPPARPRVLVVDDEPGMLATLADVLELGGYDVRTASSGEAAVAIAAVERGANVVLMDIRMPPGIDGVEAMRHIRALVPELPIVLMTAFASRGARRRRGATRHRSATETAEL
jgi:CheY-like chemotaxis protein